MIPQVEQEQGEMSIERLYGDCSEIMTALFSIVERESSLKKYDRAKCMQEPVNKALALINLILKEDKYRRQAAEAPDFISRLLSLLEKPGSPETKILILRIIATIGESDRNKIEIAKLEGYKKILRLLITENPELTQEVVRTVNHLLEFSGDPEIADLALVAPGLKSSISNPLSSARSRPGVIMGFNPKSLLSRSSVQLIRPQTQDSALPPRPKSFIMDRHLSRGTSPFDLPRRLHSTSSMKAMTGIDRVSQAISEVRGMFVQELGKIFPQLKDQDGLGILGMGNDDAGDASTEKHYIPNAEQIQFTIAYYSQLVGQDNPPIDDPESPTELPELPEPPETHCQKDSALPPDKLSSSIVPGSAQLARSCSLKKMASTPDLRATTKPVLGARRNSEDRTWSEVSKATRGAAVELAQEEELLRKSHPDNVLKEFMRNQGALRSLMTILSDKISGQQRFDLSKSTQKNHLSTGTRLATKIDIMETVCKVLFQNSANQLEFQAMDGFSTLLNVFDEIIVPTGSAKQCEQDSHSLSPESPNADRLSSILHPAAPSGDNDFISGSEHRRSMAAPLTTKRSLLLGSLLAVFFDLALDGSTRDMVQNTGAFHFLFRLLLESKQLDVRQYAMYAIQDLVSLNPLNAVAAWRCGEIDNIIGRLREYLSYRPTSGTLRDAQWTLGRQMGLDPNSPNVRSVVFCGLTYFDSFVVSEDTAVLAEMIEDGSPVYQYTIGLTRLLEYISVMLIHDNVYILYELSRLLMEVDFPDDSSIVINVVLRCVGRIVADMIARGIPVEEKFASIYLQIVRRMLENQHKRRKTSAEIDDEHEQELRDCVHTEQRLLTLHILGLVLRGMGSSVDVFELLQGFETLANTILLERRSCHHAGRADEQPATYADSLAEPTLCQDCYRSDIVVSDLALWLFRDLALQEADNGSVVAWIIVMLKSALAGIEELRRQSEATKISSKHSQGFLHVQAERQQDQAHALLAYLYTKICGTVSLIFRKSCNAKPAFGEACGMQLLLSVLSSAQHPDVATAALVAIGDFFAGYEGTKALLGDNFGYDGFLEIVLHSCRPLDKICCEIVLEVATVGNVMSSKSRPHVEAGSSIYCTEVWPFIANLSDPRPLFHSALPFTSPRKIGERNSFRTPEVPTANTKLDWPGGSTAYQTNGRGTPSRPSSVYLDESLELSNPSSTGSQILLHTGPSSTSSVISGNGGVTVGSNSRYSIFGMSPWSSIAATSASSSISLAQEHVSNASQIPTILEPGEPAGTGSSRRSSVQLQRSGRSTPAPPSHDVQPEEQSSPGLSKTLSSNRLLQTPKTNGGVVNRKRSNSRNLGGFGLNTTNLGLHSVVPSERLAFKQLAGIVFRDADAARMTLRLLGRIIDCNNPKLATDYFNLLMLLMEVTPRNKELLSQNSGLRFMLEILFRRGRQHDGLGMSTPGYPFLPRASDPPYVDLVPAMGAYDISVEDVRLLFDAVYDPLEMFFHLVAEPIQTIPTPTSTIKDSLGPLPELPTKFDKEPDSRRNSAGRPRSESASAVTPYSRRRSGSRYPNAGQGVFPGLQFNPLFIGEMEQQMMYAIEKVSERVDPPAYFNFNGLDASLTTYPGIVEKAMSAKGGYTVSVWIKVTAFLEKETGLFCYEEENGSRTIFELYFKSLDQSNRYCLCVRTQHYPSPPEDFVFDRFDFAETGIWHHIVFVHHKTMKLMVDGCVIQSYGTFNQRRQEKEGGIVGVLGRKGRNCMSGLVPKTSTFNDGTSFTNLSLSSAPQDVHQQFSSSTLSVSSSVQYSSQVPGGAQEPSLGHFCGQAGKVHFLQGEWDQAMAERVFNLGPASTESWRSHDVKSPVIAVLDPEDFLHDMESTNVEETDSAQSLGQPAARDQKKVLPHGVLQGGCTIHMTRAMRNLIGQVGGIQLCFRFLEMNPSHLQLVGLRVISNLLYKSPENIAQFQNELDGYDIMYELLSNTASELSVDHFGVLFDIAINGMIKDEHLILSSMPCVQLILRLLPSTMDSVQSYILRTLVDLIVESPENMRFWRASFGMTTLFELFRSLSAHLRPFLMWTLESMMDGMTVQELGLLIGFIGHEEADLFEVRRDIIEMLFKRMTADHGLVDLLGSGLEGVTVLIGLLDSPNEHFRILILKMIGILLSDNTKSGKAALDKPNIGIGLIRSTLEKYPLSMDVIQVLLGLAQNSYRCDPNFRSAEKGGAMIARKSVEKASTHQQQHHHQHSSIVIAPLLPTPVKEASYLGAPLEQNSGTMLNVQPPSTHSGKQISVDDPNNAKTDLQGSSQSSAGLRKHVHSNNANAPFVKMSSLPTEPLIISHVLNSATSDDASALRTSRGGAKITDELTYASMIRLILELTGSLSHTDLVTHTLTDLKRLMTSENMRILWEAGWVNWVGAFMHDKIRVRVTSAAENLSYNRAMGVLDGMMQKMMIFDLSRKGSVTVRNKGCLVSQDEDVGVQLRLTEAALAWFDKNPNLDTEAANVICKGLVILFRRLEELSRKFEENQRQAEKARQEAFKKEVALQAQIRAQEEERERLALEAVSSALNGVLDCLDDSGQSDESDSKSILLKADEGDMDAEELTIEHAGGSPASDGGAEGTMDKHSGLASGSASPTSPSTSTLSLPLSTLPINVAQAGSGQQPALDSFESQALSRSPSSHLHQTHYTSQPSHRYHQQQSRRYRPVQSRTGNMSLPSSSTPSVVPDSTGTILFSSHELGGGGILWPPLALYEHFANCINNLACYNNSAIRTAMKSSGLFKIRDSLVEKLSKVESPAGAMAMSGGIGSHCQHSTLSHFQQPSPTMGSSGFVQNQFIHQPISSSSSSTHHESDNNCNSGSNINGIGSVNGIAAGHNIDYALSANTSIVTNIINTSTGHPSPKSNRARKRPSQRQSHAGLGLGMPSVI
ncbi:hypothetical protein BC939DRAFT_312290 [Gamsiella multidivaricata]|uniref:uncharacterized protein n=1 Tax=Gamsiella multidivaricata TaxID=101098 RepID=UPI0022200AE1|nr:uncharacterized protein BC939DRAFT_312290 [Gamsiella multidivaricata]KAI7817939.1 hypothetical protein BC939DRAFT_312290 [Gamsiella multidivaricata]